VWADAFANQKACMRTAHETASALVNGALTTVNECLAAGNCDPSALGADAEAAAAAAVSDIEAACQGTARLDFFIAVTPDIYVDRTLAQVDCMVATSHADTAPLTLGCGPSNVDMDPPRGEYQQIIVDGDQWGTLCGDETEYAFLIRLAPEGERLDRIVIGLEGGGVCFTEGDCAGVNPALLNAQDTQVEETGIGIMSNDPDESPFANWTKVYLPYCNQDVFAGAGVVEDFGLPRYGAVNLRSSIQMVRDLIWKLMDEEDGDGFRPDEAVWMNTLRSDYCDTKDLNGIHYYYSTEFLEKGENRVGGGFHVISLRPDFYEREVAGIAPFPCEVAP
jgi:hypothetical protein